MKKMISTLCALMMAGSMLTLPAAAEEVSTDQPDFQQMSTLADSEITPYYAAIHNIFMNIDKNGNTVSASAECDYLSGYTAKMTVNLQRSTNNSSWTKTLDLELQTAPMERSACMTVPRFRADIFIVSRLILQSMMAARSLTLLPLTVFPFISHDPQSDRVPSRANSISHGFCVFSGGKKRSLKWR